jgi:hypothetical protein
MCEVYLWREVAVGGQATLTTEDDVVAISVEHLTTSQRAGDSIGGSAVTDDGTNVGLDVRKSRVDCIIVLGNWSECAGRFNVN